MIYSRINEFTRKRLLDRSKKDTPDKFSRRTEISDSEVSLLRVGLIELRDTDDLYIYFKVRNYRVDLRIIDFKPTLAKYLQGRFEGDLTKAITRALNHGLNYNHIQVSCTCPDFMYRYAYMATLKGYGLNTNETRPATQRNPKNKGGLCKHIMKVINAPSSWSKKVVTTIKAYVKNYV